MVKKIESTIVAVSKDDAKKFIEMGNLIKEKKCLLKYYACDFFYYEVFSEPFIVNIQK